MTKLIRMKELLTVVPFSKSHIYSLISKGEFPKPVSIGERAVAWREEDVQAWLERKF
ncbi:helix-turn-helix transcriptional regulator [Photobacterium sp. J15]|uniref:helix-turn-helix transcriptional regulator n=1 Tax=Photobacterium sp. J15 TaxID=265901 RepID=UPI0007E312B1|nr:AlpA family transcriptional regulator [Photobacterium sp. J15]